MTSLLGTLLILFCFGQKLTIGAFTPYYISYIKHNNPEIHLGQTYIFGLVAVFGALIAIFSIPFSKRFNFILYASIILLLDNLLLFFSMFV